MENDSEPKFTPLELRILEEAKVQQANAIVEGTPGFKPDMYKNIDPEGNINFTALADGIQQKEINNKP